MKYIAEIKEKMSESILKPSHTGENMTKQDLIEFWGLTEPDIEWFVLYMVIEGDNGEEILMPM